jgi:predicted transposase/invertase (TIGR01784 family)
LVFKLLFGDQRNIDLLTALLKSVLDIPENEYAEVTIIDPHLLPEYEGDKLGILDAKVKTASGKIIDIEIQIYQLPEIKERLVFYISKMVTEQIGEGENYDSIKRVISIVITDFELVKGDNKYHHRFTLYDQKNCKEFTDLIELHTLELPKLPAESDNTELYNWLTFIKSERKEEFDMVAQTNPQINTAVGRLIELSATEKARMLYETREKARRDEASRMNGMRKTIASNALKKGLSVEDIADITGLPITEIESLRSNT